MALQEELEQQVAAKQQLALQLAGLCLDALGFQNHTVLSSCSA
jgi:hypothetical protein